MLDHCGKILILTLDAVGRPERATHPPTSAVGQVHRERVRKRTSKLHHVLRGIYAAVQQDHARPLAQSPIADPRTVSGHHRPRRNDVCFVSHMVSLGRDAIHVRFEGLSASNLLLDRYQRR